MKSMTIGSVLLYNQLDGATLALLLVLAVLSISCLATFLAQWYKQRRIIKGLKHLMRALRQSREPHEFQSHTDALSRSGLSSLRCACVEYMAQQDAQQQLAHVSEGDGLGLLESAMQLVSVQIDAGLQFLQTVAAIAPLLGLLGTIWGLMNVFQVLGGDMSGITLWSAGPGIAQAMITTVAGLVVAIPTTVGIGLLSSMAERSQILCEQLLWEIQARPLVESRAVT